MIKTEEETVCTVHFRPAYAEMEGVIFF